MKSVSEIRIPVRDGWFVVFDTEDIENISADFTNHPGLTIDGPNGSMQTLPSGSSTLDLHIDFSGGRKPQWIQAEPKPA